MKTRHISLTAILIAATAAALFAVGGPQHNVAAQETQNSEQNSTIKTRKAACRCGKLSVTYNGPEPERITLCHCNSCQSRTGTMFSVQGRFPRGKAKIEGKSTKWTFPSESGKRVTYRSCDSGGPRITSALCAVRPFTGTLPRHRT